MKKKFGLWLNIVTICLCVCAIAIGVYAATSATLTISGQIGFEAHGVDVSVAGTLSGYVTGENEATVQNGTNLGTVTLANNDSKAMSLGENPVYFTDLAGETIPSITLKLDITNNSKFKVRANVSFPTTTTNNVSISAEKETLVLNENGGVGEVTYTFAISNAETSITDTLNLATITDLKVDFVKFTGYEQGEFYVEDGKLYVEYGYYPTLDEKVTIYSDLTPNEDAPLYGDNLGKSIRWVAFSNNLDDATPAALTDLTEIPTSGSYYFVSEFVLDKRAFDADSNDYSSSDIRTYLTGDFVAKFALSDLVNNVAETRAVSTSNDKLWLLDSTEAGLIETFFGTYATYYPSQAAQVYSSTSMAWDTGVLIGWWLRSSIDTGSSVQYINSNLYVNNLGIYELTCTHIKGIRPAFQINLSK